MNDPFNVVFLLGAGASAPGGCPVMNNFFQVAESLYHTGQLDDFKRQYEAINKKRLELHRSRLRVNFDIDNLESVFNAIEMLELETTPKGDTNYQLRYEFTQLIAAVLSQTQKYSRISIDYPTNKPQHISPIAPAEYNRLIDIIHKMILTEYKNYRGDAIRKPKYKSTILTFNYDIGTEIALVSSGFKISYGFNVDQENSSIDDYEIPVYKLHGSINWMMKDDVILDHPDRSDQISNVTSRIANYLKSLVLVQQLQALDTARHFKKIAEERDYRWPFIVPPSDSKGQHRDQVRNVWKHAIRALRQADMVVFIGYSLPDTDHFCKQLFAVSGLPDPTEFFNTARRLRRVYVIDKCNNGIDSVASSRIKSMISPSLYEKYNYSTNGFAHGIFELTDLLEKEKWIP